MYVVLLMGVRHRPTLWFITINLLIQLCYCNRPPDNKSFLLCNTNTHTHYMCLSTRLGRRQRRHFSVRLPSRSRIWHTHLVPTMRSKNCRVQEKCNKRWQNHLRRRERERENKQAWGYKKCIWTQSPYYANSFINLWQRGFQQPDREKKSMEENKKTAKVRGKSTK